MEAVVADLWRRFRDPILQRVTVLEHAVLALEEGQITPEQRVEAQREAHKLKGSLGTFGFPEGSRLVAAMEPLLRAPELSQGHVQNLKGLVQDLAELLRQAEPTAPPEPEVAPAASHPLLLIIDTDTPTVERLAREAHAQGLRTVTATDVTEVRASMVQERPRAVLMDIMLTGKVDEGLALLSELTEGAASMPVLVLTERDEFALRVEVAQRGGAGYIQKPAAVAQVVEWLRQAILPGLGSDATVLVVDDDPQILAALVRLLQPLGLNVVTLESPLRFWDVLEDCSPDLVVTDYDMPHLSGIDLCRVLRNDPRWSALPVLFLTAQTDAETVRRVFAAGADDYVRKPFVGPELTTRIANRLERTQMHRRLAETDVLTGVANRRKSVQVLEHLLRLAGRQQQPLSLVILDLDKFKVVNDRYGHAAGDLVLRRMGEILLGSFRGEDIVARWGGEEFVIGMYSMQKENAVRRIATLLDQLRREVFAGTHGSSFQVSFSAGVAQYPVDGADLPALYRAADEALYRAKGAGRNQVLSAGAC